MADIIPQRARGVRNRLPALRLDMTPLVDLAFLLLSFFILTTTLRRLEGMDLIAPLGGAGKEPVRQLTFLVGGRDTICGYAGVFDPATTVPERYGLDQVRHALRQVGDTTGLALYIKPRPNARYADVLGVVDACELSKLWRYSILDSSGTAEWHAALRSLAAH